MNTWNRPVQTNATAFYFDLRKDAFFDRGVADVRVERSFWREREPRLSAHRSPKVNLLHLTACLSMVYFLYIQIKSLPILYGGRGAGTAWNKDWSHGFLR